MTLSNGVMRTLVAVPTEEPPMKLSGFAGGHDKVAGPHGRARAGCCAGARCGCCRA